MKKHACQLAPGPYHRASRAAFLGIFTTDEEALQGALHGMGRSLTPAVIAMLGTCVFRLIWVAAVLQWPHAFEPLMAVYLASLVLAGTGPSQRTSSSATRRSRRTAGAGTPAAARKGPGRLRAAKRAGRPPAKPRSRL